MEQDQLDELMVCRLNDTHKAVEPCSIVIFGASGDLTARKLIPALIPTTIPIPMVWRRRILGKAKTELDPTTHWEKPLCSIALRKSIINACPEVLAR